MLDLVKVEPHFHLLGGLQVANGQHPRKCVITTCLKCLQCVATSLLQKIAHPEVAHVRPHCSISEARLICSTYNHA